MDFMDVSISFWKFMSNYWLRYLFSVFAMLLSSNAMSQWIEYSKTAEGESYYQPRKIQIQDGFLYISVLKNFQSNHVIVDKQGSEQTYLSEGMTVIVNCAQSSYATPDISYHSQVDGRGRLVHFVTEAPHSLSWLDNSPSSDMAPLIRVTKKLCKS